ncbi:MAG TPA: MFS transporter [Capillimicrobium sp.]|nr:MFS transporter [Capillimicrobium sp.]
MPPPAVTRTSLWLGAALLLVAVTLRLPIASVPPIVADVQAGLGLSSAAAGAITTLPVLCFGLAAPLAPGLARRWGDELVVLGCLVLLSAGVAMRLVPEVAPFYLGTLLLGLGIAIANVLIPSVVKRWYPRPGAMTGLYVTMMMGGAAVAAATAVPLEDATGDWTWALAAFGVPALVAALVWLPAVRVSRTEPGPPPPRVSLWRDPTAWLLTGMMASQSLLFYAILAWTPEIVADAGLGDASAGVMLSIAMLLGIPTSLALPVLAGRTDDQRPLVLLAGGVWLAGLLGLLLAPGTATVVWMVLVGLGQGGGFALTMALLVLRATDAPHAAALSGMVQSIGYTVAAAGPSVVGVIHDATGSWRAPVAFLLAVGASLVACGLAAARPARVPAPY